MLLQTFNGRHTQNLISVMINCMLVMVRDLLSIIPHIISCIHQTQVFTLSNILHVPHIKKKLLSIQQFCCENYVFFEFHSSVFYVKDLITKEVLLSGQSKDGHYVLSESSATSLPHAFLSTSMTTFADIWHRRLGHPSPVF